MSRLFLITMALFTAGCGQDHAANLSVSVPAGHHASAATRIDTTRPEVEAAGVPAPESAGVMRDIDLAEPTVDEPVVVGAANFPPAAMPGDLVTIVVRAKIADGWYIYDMNGASGPARPTALSLALPDGVETTGEWTTPKTEIHLTSLGPVSTYRGDFVFRRQLRVSDTASAGATDVTCEFHYQACDPARCLMPAKVSMRVPFTITSREE